MKTEFRTTIIIITKIHGFFPRYWAKYFTSIISSNFHKDIMSLAYYYYPHFAGEETEVQRDLRHRVSKSEFEIRNQSQFCLPHEWELVTTTSPFRKVQAQRGLGSVGQEWGNGSRILAKSGA